MKTEDYQFFTDLNQKALQDIKKSFKEAHSNAKIYQISTAPLRNSTTVTILPLIDNVKKRLTLFL